MDSIIISVSKYMYPKKTKRGTHKNINHYTVMVGLLIFSPCSQIAEMLSYKKDEKIKSIIQILW